MEYNNMQVKINYAKQPPNPAPCNAVNAFILVGRVVGTEVVGCLFLF
jgi:hypothetical protein